MCGKYVVTVESLLQWIQWLDWQEGPRGEAYRAGITAGQAVVLRSLNAKGLELDPIDFEKYLKPVSSSIPAHEPLLTFRKKNAASTKAQTNLGVRLVDNDNGINDRGDHAVTKTLGSMATDSHSTTLSDETPDGAHDVNGRARNNATHAISNNLASSSASNAQYHDPDSWGSGPGTMSMQFVHSKLL